MSGRHEFPLWDLFDGRRHIVDTLINRADGLRFRTLCGLDFRRPDPDTGEGGYGYCRNCSAKKAAERNQARRS